MNEITDVLKKYDEDYISKHLTSVTDLNLFALTFFKDAADIYDTLTRVRNVERNPVGFDLTDAPILGLLVRIWKLLKEIIKYYEANNAEIISILERPLIEASIMSTYLMANDHAVMEDYRKCSYKDRLRLLRDMENGSPFFDTKAGKRLLNSIKGKMEFENLTTADFDTQKKNRWRVQGKTFRDIFAAVDDDKLYGCTYGMMSESIHGSWNESLDYCLTKDTDGIYSPFPFFQSADIRFVSPTLRFTNKPFRLWLKRIDLDDADLIQVLDWIDRVNNALFRSFDEAYDG